MRPCSENPCPDNPQQKVVPDIDDFDSLQPRFCLGSGLLVAALTALGVGLGEIITPIDQAMIYLIGIVFVAAKLGRVPSILYSLLSVCCFNFFFIPPLYSFDIYDRSYWLTFVVMLLTSFVITSQASRLRLQATFARRRERDTQNFYALTRELATSRNNQDIADVADKHISKMFGIKSVIGLPDESGRVQNISEKEGFVNNANEQAIFQWCFENSKRSRYPTTNVPGTDGLYFPLVAGSRIFGVLGCAKTEKGFTSDDMSSLETCASLLTSALERINSVEIAEKSKIEAESDRLRTLLLSSVSHDLRTPLASITGAASTIATDTERLSRDTIRDLGDSIYKEAERLSHLVSNLLEVTRLESDTVQLNLQPYFVEELIGSALGRLETVLAKHKLIPQSDQDLPLVLVDGMLIEQVLINLLENAAHYTNEGGTITVSASRKGDHVVVSVADNGSGIETGKEKQIFDKFYSMRRKGGIKGTGLGLAICACIIHIHKGEIWAKNGLEGGACFYFTLPIADEMPEEVKNAVND